MMRRILWGLVTLAILWCLWWGVAAFGLHSGVTAWFEERRVQGWQADLGGVSLGGFPNRVAAQLDDLVLADTNSGVAVGMDQLDLSFRTIWPGDMRVTFPATPVTVATPNGAWDITAQMAVADMNLHPGSALELDAMALTSGPFEMQRRTGGSLFAASGLTLSLTQSDRPQEYALSFDVPELTPGSAMRQDLLIPSDWPLVFDVLRLDADIAFDTALDRRVLEGARAQPQQIALHRAEMRWGEIRFLATGDITRDPDGLAVGTLTLKAENWVKMLDLAELSGLIPAQLRPTIEGPLRALAAGTGSTDDLDVTLTFGDGLTRIGFLPLGPAPSLVIR